MYISYRKSSSDAGGPKLASSDVGDSKVSSSDAGGSKLASLDAENSKVSSSDAGSSTATLSWLNTMSFHYCYHLHV